MWLLEREKASQLWGDEESMLQVVGLIFILMGERERD